VTQCVGSKIEISDDVQTVRRNGRLLGDCAVDVRYHHFVRRVPDEDSRGASDHIGGEGEGNGIWTLLEVELFLSGGQLPVPLTPAGEHVQVDQRSASEF